MKDYYKNAIIETLDKLNESKLCFIYTLMMNLGFREAEKHEESEATADAV